VFFLFLKYHHNFSCSKLHKIFILFLNKAFQAVFFPDILKKDKLDFVAKKAIFKSEFYFFSFIMK